MTSGKPQFPHPKRGWVPWAVPSMPETSLRQISTHNCQTPKLPTALKRAASFTGCWWGHQGERECAAEDRNVASVTGRPCWSSLSPLSLGPSDLWAPSPAPTAPKISSLAPSHSALPPPPPPQLADPSQPSHSSAVCSQPPSAISQVLPPHRDFKHFAAFKSGAKLALLQQLRFQYLSVPRTKGTDR